MTFLNSSAITRTSDCKAAPSRPSILTVFAIWKERRALAQMDISRLKDLGISPQDAATEAARPFWDLPSNARK